MPDLQMLMTHDVGPASEMQDRDANPFLITAIGSCRITGPLRIMQKTEPVVLNQSAVYGYSHACTELRAQLTHLLNKTRPPKNLFPLLAPSEDGSSDHFTPHNPSDFYVFELSSAKHLSVDGHPVQLNYLNRHFQDFFCDTNRARAYWSHARRLDATAMTNFLRNLPEYLSLSQKDQWILRHLELRSATQDRLCQDIEAMRNAVPDHLFVTHFDAISKNGTLLKGRADYLKMVRHALIDCNANWYDPSQSINTFGQDLALDDAQGSLSHFSGSFEKYLSSNWWVRFVQPAFNERRMDAQLRHRIRATAKAATQSSRPALI